MQDDEINYISQKQLSAPLIWFVQMTALLTYVTPLTWYSSLTVVFGCAYQPVTCKNICCIGIAPHISIELIFVRGKVISVLDYR